ncbi:hypothetical protein VNO77_22617 [Canavalia gladiata]|uniref:Uncharacterized protein n=1 Tax=Canavalia gladiata TaxID=3824 RepID=A0AAN9L857_CANGL
MAFTWLRVVAACTLDMSGDFFWGSWLVWLSSIKGHALHVDGTTSKALLEHCYWKLVSVIWFPQSGLDSMVSSKRCNVKFQ